MISESEMNRKIEEVTKDYKGDIGYFYEAVGMLVVGRLFGWRVIRLVSSGRSWSLVNRLFGDLKVLLPERGKYSSKSVGLKITDEIGDYWDFIQRIKTMPIQDRKMVQ